VASGDLKLRILRRYNAVQRCNGKVKLRRQIKSK